MTDGGGADQAPGDIGARRRVAAIDITGLAVGAAQAWTPVFEWVDPADLLVDEAYQRSLSDKSLSLIRKIVRGWDWAKFKPPIVASTPEGFVVIDGQHTAIGAASHPGIEQIPVMIVSATSVEAQAASFLGHNRDRLSMTQIQVHRAAVAARDPDALAVEGVATAAGVRLPPYLPSNGAWAPRDCVAFQTLYALVTRRGPRLATRILKILADANLAPVTSWQIKAVERLLSEKEYEPPPSGEAISEALRALGPNMLSAVDLAAAQYRVRRPHALAVLLFRKANAGRRRAA